MSFAEMRSGERPWPEGFEFLRAPGGRRNAEQIRGMFGDVDAEPYLPIISFDPLPSEPPAV